MAATAPGAAASVTASAAASPDTRAGHSGFDTSSAFEASSFERSLGAAGGTRWIGWRRRALALAALLGCLALFSWARWLAASPQLEPSLAVAPNGALVLEGSKQPSLAALRGRVVAKVAAAAAPAALGPAGAAPANPPANAPATAPANVAAAAAAAAAAVVPVDALLLHRWPRWQVDDAARQRQVAQHEGVARLLAAAGPSGTVELLLDDGTRVPAAVVPRRFGGLGLLFWPLCGVALLLYLFAVVVVLARPQPRSLLFVAMAICQGGGLLFIAMEAARGLGLPPGAIAADMPVRLALDLCTGAAAVHLLALHPLRLPHAHAIAGLAWATVAVCIALAWQGLLTPLWSWTQAACLALSAAALAVAWHSHRSEPNPYALVMRRLAAATLATLALATAAVAAASGLPAARASSIAAGVSVAWYLFFASLLLLTPFLARSRLVLREFALLAGISTVATSLDLLFVSVFSLGTFTSLAIAVFIGLGLYAGARQWVLSHLLGTSMLTTERTFDQLYRAARAVQARPRHYPQLLAQLLQELFEPLEMLRVQRVPVRARVIGGGAALVVPMRTADEHGAPSVALVLRFARRGQRLFTRNDARLADRVTDQLRRAVAYDQAVERGRHEERLRIAQDLHDDIGARLLTLMYQAQSREMEDYIRHTLQDLKTLTRGLAAAEHRLSHAAAEWKTDITQRLTAAHVALGWSFTFDRDLRLSVVQWSALTRVLRELVSNALYHGHASRIDIGFQLEGPTLTLQVADDGCGRQPQGWSHGLGLGGVRKRVKALAGTVDWRENGEQGIVCAVRVPDFQGRSGTPDEAAPA